MEPFNVMAHIHSLNGEMREITVLEQETMFGHPIPNAYIVQYGGVKCTAVFDTIVCAYYADDKYGIIKENNE
ncbi:MAG: hypothetical protein ACI4M0_00560 [Christensenellales bacterium]